MLRISVANAGNDHRLGASEAPPAIISMYLGEELDAVLSAIETGKSYNSKKRGVLKIGVTVLPTIPKDSTDRNRTSPFAFTGNKFEFRMVGSSENIACPNFILNTIVAEALSQFADVLENAEDFNSALNKLIKDTIIAHKRILFSGNNYSEEWKEEAKRRGLLNLESTVDALVHYGDEKNVKVFEKHNVLSMSEINSRAEILLEKYTNVIHIEALTAIDMARKEIAPAVIGYEKFLIEELALKNSLSKKLSSKLEEKLIEKLAALSDEFSEKLDKLVLDEEKFASIKGTITRARYSRDVLLFDMEDLRKTVDEMELLTGKEFIPFPTYEDILYSVKY